MLVEISTTFSAMVRDDDAGNRAFYDLTSRSLMIVGITEIFQGSERNALAGFFHLRKQEKL